MDRGRAIGAALAVFLIPVLGACSGSESCSEPGAETVVTIENATASLNFNHYILATCGENDGSLKYFDDLALPPGAAEPFTLGARTCAEVRVFAAGCGLSEPVATEELCDGDTPVLEVDDGDFTCDR